MTFHKVTDVDINEYTNYMDDLTDIVHTYHEFERNYHA